MLPESPADRRYWVLKGTPLGPYSPEQVLERWQGGEFPPETTACLVGEQTWLPLGQFSDFTGKIPPSVPALTTLPSMAVSSSEATSASGSFTAAPIAPSATARTPRYYRLFAVLGVSLVIGFSAWLGIKIVEWIFPGPERVARKFVEAESAVESKKYSSKRMQEFCDAMFADDSSNNPNDKLEITTTVAGSSDQIKLVGYRGSLFIAEAGRRVGLEGHLRIIKEDGWKVDDVVINGMEGVALDRPLSLLDLLAAEKAAKNVPVPKKSTATPVPLPKSSSASGVLKLPPPPSPIELPPFPSPKIQQPKPNPPSTSDPFTDAWEFLKRDWKKVLLGIVLLLVVNYLTSLEKPGSKQNVNAKG